MTDRTNKQSKQMQGSERYGFEGQQQIGGVDEFAVKMGNDKGGD